MYEKQAIFEKKFNKQASSASSLDENALDTESTIPNEMLSSIKPY